MTMIKLKRFDASAADFDSSMSEWVAWSETTDRAVVDTVRGIIADVRQRGDEAVLEYTRRFDRYDAASVSALALDHAALAQALVSIPAAQREALQAAAERIRVYHERQRLESWQYRDADGTVLGQMVRPLDSVGLYVPGGKATYPSSVLMNAIPAKVAGVKKLVMVVPAPEGDVNPMVLAAAAIAGVDHVFTVGGAQAVAALAYGTSTIPAVDKIVGPGNIYVATAKREVFGKVGIDMIAGPSEILVICDGQTDPEWVAMDLFSQAEHDEQAQSILVCPDADFLDRVEAAANRLLPTMERRDIIAASMNGRGALVKVRDLTHAAEVSNLVAPEHLELSVADADALLPQLRHAGAIFLGRYTAEALGDYCAGPNHVLPTSGTARFSSPLGVYDFQKRSSLIGFTAAGADKAGRIASVLARGEGLTAHARSAEYRLNPTDPT